MGMGIKEKASYAFVYVKQLSIVHCLADGTASICRTVIEENISVLQMVMYFQHLREKANKPWRKVLKWYRVLL